MSAKHPQGVQRRDTKGGAETDKRKGGEVQSLVARASSAQAQVAQGDGFCLCNM